MLGASIGAGSSSTSDMSVACDVMERSDRVSSMVTGWPVAAGLSLVCRVCVGVLPSTGLFLLSRHSYVSLLLRCCLSRDPTAAPGLSWQTSALATETCRASRSRR
jgi:hypothetical protein